MKCELCEHVIWTYYMREHFEDKHPNTPMSSAFAQSVARHMHEADTVPQLLATPLRSCKIIGCAGTSCPCKR